MLMESSCELSYVDTMILSIFLMSMKVKQIRAHMSKSINVSNMRVSPSERNQAAAITCLTHAGGHSRHTQ